MPQFLISVFREHGFDASVEIDAAMVAAIDGLNQRMMDAGIRVFVGGLQPPKTARSIHTTADKMASVNEGTCLKGSLYLDGFWVIDVANMDTAEDWGRGAAKACRAVVEVRPFYG